MTQAISLVVHRIHGFENINHFEKREDVVEKILAEFF
jgi:hypothetical protein